MQNFFENITHRLYLPKFSHFDANSALESLSKICSQDLIIRVSKCAIPVLSSLDLTSKKTIYICKSIQIAQHINSLILSKDKKSSLNELFQLTITVTSVAASMFNWKLGLLATSSISVFESLKELTLALKNRDKSKIYDASLQLITNSAYLSILLTGSLEIGLACTVFQLLLTSVDTVKHFRKGEYLEGLSKLIILGLKSNQGLNQYELIQKKNAYLKLAKFKNLIDHLNNVKKINHFDSDHPLINLEDRIEENQVNLDGSENSFGSYFFGLGQGTVKGMNLEFQNIEDEKIGTILNFNINHANVSPIRNALIELSNLDKQSVLELFSIFSIEVDDFSIKRQNIPFEHSYLTPSEIGAPTKYEENFSFEMFELNFKGLGAIRLATSDEYWYMKSHIQVFLENGKNIYDLHTVLSFVGLENVLKLSSEIDLERMKIGHLFRCFFPTDAKKFEVTKEFFSLPIESLKSKIVSLVPEMDIIFTRYLDKMSLYQIFPGKYRFKINGLKEDLKELGAYGLSSAIFGENLTERVISILKMGMIAAEIRDAHNLNSPGLSSEIDKWSGGSDSVFTQMITESTQSYDNLAYQSNIRILFDLEVIETGTYQYSIDILGLRRRDYYGAYDLSLGIFDFTDSIQQEHTISYMGHEIIIEDSYAHELMVKERISPNWIKGLVVKNELIKKELVQALNQANMLKKDELGRDTILGILLDSFIHIGSEVKKEQFFI